MAGGRIAFKPGRRPKTIVRAPVEFALPQAELEALARRAVRRAEVIIKAKDSLIDFVQLMMPSAEDPDDVDASDYQPADFHYAIARALERLERGGEYRNLILAMPPRHGKTQLATKMFVPWVIGRNPKWHVAVGSYSDEMAEDFGAAIRACMQSENYAAVFPNAKLAKGGAAKNRIEIDAGPNQQNGMIVAVGRGGALTGRGANLAIVDDPFKDFEEARSQAIRDQAWNWFTKVVLTRRMGKKLLLLIMTRWHEDDIIGRLTDPSNPYYRPSVSASFKIINLPALATDDDPLKRKPGTPLWPSHFDREFLLEQREIDPLGFQAMYQQSPVIEDGDLFKREHVRYYDAEHLPRNLRIYAASDHALGGKLKHDKTCMIIAGVDEYGRIYLLDCYWRRARADVVVEQMLDMARLRQPILWGAPTDHIAKAIGPFLYKRMQETETFFQIREFAPIGDKVQGAQAIAGRFAMGYVHFPKGAWWTEPAIDELMRFGPQSNRDDFVDALALLGRMLLYQVNASAPNAGRSEPRYGSFAWLKLQAQRQSDEARRTAAAGGY